MCVCVLFFGFNCLYLCYDFCSVQAGTVEISRSNVQIGVVILSVPPQIRFFSISACFSCSSQFQPILTKMHFLLDMNFGLLEC